MRIFVYFILLAVALTSGCEGDQPTTQPVSGQTVQKVAISTMLYSPATIEVKVGETVEWKNDDLVPHTVTSTSFDSGSIASGQTWRHKFTKADSFSYVCSFHPTMKGEVIAK